MAKVHQMHLRILEELKANAGKYVSGNQLAAQLGLSRTGIWKHIRKLKSMGYLIVVHPKQGYQLCETPDLLVPEEVLPCLDTVWLGRSYYHFVQTDSTNERALHLAAGGAEHGTVVVAEEQLRGRGRQQRSWHSPPNCGIYVTLIVKNRLPLRMAPQCTMIASLALVRTLKKQYGLEATIKWPNDVLLGDRKIAGILAEMHSDEDYTRFVVIGIGINVNHRESDLEGPFRYPAGSLAIALRRSLSRKEVLCAFLGEFESLYEEFCAKGFAGFLSEFESVSAILGKWIKVLRDHEEISGTASGFTEEGALRIRKAEGETEILWAGDITRIEEYR